MRIIKNLRSANWTELTLELVVVVVGILLALAIDSFSAERQERILEQSLLSQLQADLEGADEQISAQLAQTEAAAAAAVNLLAAARDERVATDDSVAAWLTRISWWSDPHPTTASAQALVSTNSLHLIQSDELRSGIVRFLDQVRQLELRIPRFEEELTVRMSGINRLVDPLERGQVVYVGVLDAGVEAHVSGTVGGEVTADLQALLDEPTFKDSAREMFWVHENLRWLQRWVLDATRELAAQVGAEVSDEPARRFD